MKVAIPIQSLVFTDTNQIIVHLIIYKSLRTTKNFEMY